MIVFKIENNRIVQRRNEDDNYVLLDDEFGFNEVPISYTIIDNVITDTTTQEQRDEQLSDSKDSKLDELHILVNIELEELQGLINDNQILLTVGRNEKPIPQQAKNWASSVLDQQEDIENEINALTTLEEVQNYVIVIE